MTQYLVLDHVARAYLYLVINTGEKDMFFELSRDKIMIVLELSRDKIMTNSTPCGPSFLDPTLSLIISNFHFWYHNHYSYNYLVILVFSTQHVLSQNLMCLLEVGQEAQCIEQLRATLQAKSIRSKSIQRQNQMAVSNTMVQTKSSHQQT